MASHVYHEIFLHLNWHTKHDAPLLQSSVEEFTYREIREKASRIPGVTMLALGGIVTHVHLALRIQPQVCISDVVQELKGASSFEVNKRAGHKALEWQRGYGVVSFGRRNLPWIEQYIATQAQHHAAGTTQARLEFSGSDGEPAAEQDSTSEADSKPNQAG